MICIFRQESKKREQDGLSPVAIVMITLRRMISFFLIYADGAEAYSGLRRIQNRGETGNAYGGCGMVDENCDVLGAFFDYVVEKYEDSMPPMAGAWISIYQDGDMMAHIKNNRRI